MCTVTYLPTPRGYILTHNRDEAPSRSAPGIDRAKVGGDTLLLPRDTGAGGSWIAAAQSGKLAFVINGAFVRHRHEPPYRRSRGLMLLDFFEFSDPLQFFKLYNFEGIEPFTFVWVGPECLVQLRWDGAQKHVEKRSPGEAAFWCSATLYPPEMQVKREAVFTNWQAELKDWRTRPTLAADILALHHAGSVGDPEYDFVMNRHNRVRTVSITQVQQNEGVFLMIYRELLNGSHDTKQLRITREDGD